MASKQQIQAIQTYADLMEEIKIRLRHMEFLLREQAPIQMALADEQCSLQLRMICETIAIACLVAHGDIVSANGRLKKEWAADRVMTQLSKLHPNFFPAPFIMREEPDLSRTLTPAPPGYLTQQELCWLYHQCGDKLHRGNLRSIAKRPMQQARQPERTKSWMNKITALLGRHLLCLLDEKTKFICLLWNSSDQGRVQVAIAEANSE